MTQTTSKRSVPRATTSRRDENQNSNGNPDGGEGRPSRRNKTPGPADGARSPLFSPMTRDQVLDLVQRAALGDKAIHVGACRILLDEMNKEADAHPGPSHIDELAKRRQGATS